MKDKKYVKVRDNFHYAEEYGGAAHSKKVPIVFHNGSDYDYHFTIKELAEELNIYVFRRKYWKIHTLYSSNRK